MIKGTRKISRFFLAAAGKSPSLSNIVRGVRAGGTLGVTGLVGAGAAFVLAVVREGTRRPVLLITEGERQMEEAEEDLVTLAGDGVYCFPSWETLPDENIEPHADIVGERFLLLDRLLRGIEPDDDPPLIVTTLRSLSQRVVEPRGFRSSLLEIERGSNIPMERLVRFLEGTGYRRVEMVEGKGEYCVRGGIVDLYAPAADYPCRLDFFGDRLDSIRTFHAQTQRSLSELESVTVTPSSELTLLKRHRDRLGTLFDYLPEDTLIAVREPAACLSGEGGGKRGGPFFLSRTELGRAFGRKQFLALSTLQDCSTPLAVEKSITLDLRSLEQYRALALGKELGEEWQKRIFGHISAWAREGMRIIVFCNNEGERGRLRELLAASAVSLPDPGGLFIGRLSGGFVFRDGGLVVLTDHEIFARYKIRRPRRRFMGTTLMREFTELRPGDYVVHVRHGVGLYRGVKKIEKDGREREFMCIEYMDRARLYVPLEQASLVERYVGLGKAPPRLDRLGGKRWQAVKRAAQRAIFDFAADILELQAARRSRPGHAFSSDTDWQRDFEDAFVYEETPDQETAIEDVKRDMESPHPMDRLVCGDVGYGKTEVAMRAAFKAVMDGRQVAVLVPTTILAQQHFGTFTDRFADYPVRIEMLSRFRTAGEQERVIRDLGAGGVDIVIGTHRLLQPDVRFKELGLVIIDEEQRFGVRHKEWLKKLRLTVDVLTMTATPIPRTLYMSLAGIRDMSTINTPPEDRLAIETFVREYDRDLVRDAIRRELSRQGQVYFVHNRVETIGKVKEALERLVPEATFAIGHGQMAGDELEEVMKMFVEGKIDVLVCTTIIESGLDIPNVNTIIVDRADRFGLADLYQLRGRVGRYRHRAYAYFLYPGGMPLLDDARRRLKAVMEHTNLGSGFKIALRDLEIRGAGNILGQEQHGHIAAVGFDLYCKLLKKSIAALRGREIEGIEEIELNLPFEAGIPEDYVPVVSQRIDLHKRLGEVTGEGDIEEIAAEMRDRFGPLPDETKLLLELYRLKLGARDRMISSIRIREDKIIATRHGEDIRPGGRYPRVPAGKPIEIVRAVRRAIEGL